MLVSPIRVHGILTDLLETQESAGPHTALLITPQGQLLCHATLPDTDDDSLDGDSEGSGAVDGDGDGDVHKGNGHGPGSEDGGYDAASDEDEGDDDEPWLEGPERLRLLLGLASQWEEDESPRVECEVSTGNFCRVLPANSTAWPPVSAPHRAARA